MVRALAVDAGDLFVGTDDATDVADLAEMTIASMTGRGADDATLRAVAGGGEVAEGPAAAALNDAFVVLNELGDGELDPGEDDVAHIKRDVSVVIGTEVEQEVNFLGGWEGEVVGRHHPAGEIVDVIGR